jgi:3-deoxy-D-manno-octulosonic-acid transferase
MIVYSLLLTFALAGSAPWWGWQMLVSGRYRAGLGGRLGLLPARLDEARAQRAASAGLVWVHAVSVGEVLAVQRLLAELQAALPGYLLVVSTTTETGQQIAREKLGGVPVFYYPLDFAFAVRRYLRALRPSLFVTVESEFWPRMLAECERAKVPAAVVNARISDRSFPRYRRLRPLWRPLLAKVSLFMAQGEETAGRLRELGVATEHILVSGNLKYDLLPQPQNAAATRLHALLGGKPLVVAGSTLAGEEDLILQAWREILRSVPETILLLAPRHPQRFEKVLHSKAFQDVSQYRGTWTKDVSMCDFDEEECPDDILEDGSVILLDTLGDLQAIYELASVAFVGGSLVPKGGHNPLEPARFGVPVVMGPSYENFREIVTEMLARDAIKITDALSLGPAIVALLKEGKAMGLRGQAYFDSQSGATARTVKALVALVERRA